MGRAVHQTPWLASCRTTKLVLKIYLHDITLMTDFIIYPVALVQNGDIKNITPLSQRKSLERMPFMACVVKECKPNGLGDMLITMKVSLF